VSSNVHASRRHGQSGLNLKYEPRTSRESETLAKFQVEVVRLCQGESDDKGSDDATSSAAESNGKLDAGPVEFAGCRGSLIGSNVPLSLLWNLDALTDLLVKIMKLHEVEEDVKRISGTTLLQEYD